MTEYELEEDKIIKILTQVQVMKREAEMQLEKQQFGEKRKINRTKKGESFKKKRKNHWIISKLKFLFDTNSECELEYVNVW